MRDCFPSSTELSFHVLQIVIHVICSLISQHVKIITNEEGEATTDTKQSIIRNYCERLYANKMEDLEEMNKILGICNISSLNQKEI